MKSTNYTSFVMPIPNHAEYELEIVDASEITGKNPDYNGEFSKGIKLTFSIVSNDATLTDGTSAVGYVFSQTWWEPRQSLFKDNPKAATRMQRDIAGLIKSAFKDEAPEEIKEHDWIGRKLNAYVSSTFDDFQGETVPKISRFA